MNLYQKICIITITLSLVLLLTRQVNASEASFLLLPGSDTFTQGEFFEVEIRIETDQAAINAAQAVIHFPNDKIEIIDISKQDSIFNLWVQEPNFSNKIGRVSLVGGLPHPGFVGEGKVAVLHFKAKQAGMVELSLTDGRILANDGYGTDILTFIKEAKYLIQSKKEDDEETMMPLFKIISDSHPYSEEWYSNNNPFFSWSMIGKTGVSFNLDKESTTAPDQVFEGLTNSQDYQNLENGIWFFHLRTKDEAGWGEPFHYKIQIDISPPLPFEVIINNNGDLTNPNPELYFDTQDSGSGLSHYKIKIDEQDFSKVMLAQINPFVLPNQAPGNHSLAVRAVDMAGNNTESKTVVNIKPIESPEITICPSLYRAGEETLYFSGKGSKDVVIKLFLIKDQKNIAEWQALSNEAGDWFFSTRELLKPGVYYLSARAEDTRGALSQLSAQCIIEVSLSGLTIGSVLISFKNLVWFLLFILLLGAAAIFFLVYRYKQAVRGLRREIKQARQGLGKSFDVLEKEIEKKIEFFDSQPGFSRSERMIYQSLKKDLHKAEESVDKEIKDIAQKAK